MAWRDGLEGAERAAYEIGKGDLVRDLALMVPDPETRTRYGSVLHEVWPPATDAGLVHENLAPGSRAPALESALLSGAAIGLDPEEQTERIALGGTRNAGLAQDWIDRDTGAVLRARGLDPGKATLEQKREAWAALDAFNDRVTEAAMGLAAEREFGAGAAAGVIEPAGPVAEPRGSDATAESPDVPTAPPSDRSETPPWLAVLASRLRSGDHADRAEHGYRYALEYELRQEIGSDGLLALQKGRADVLAPVLPDPADRLAVARAYVEVLAAERGDPGLARTIATLRTAEAELAAKTMSRARTAERDRSRSLDDDLDL